MSEIKFTMEEISAALNKAVDDVSEALDLPDAGVVDAFNLIANATSAYLQGTATDLEEVAQEQYSESLDTILSWIESL